MDTDDEDNDNATAAGSSSEMNELPVTLLYSPIADPLVLE